MKRTNVLYNIHSRELPLRIKHGPAANSREHKHCIGESRQYFKNRVEKNQMSFISGDSSDQPDHRVVLAETQLGPDFFGGNSGRLNLSMSIHECITRTALSLRTFAEKKGR